MTKRTKENIAILAPVVVGLYLVGIYLVSISNAMTRSNHCTFDLHKQWQASALSLGATGTCK